MNSNILNPLFGGALIGVAVSIMLLMSGKIAGNSGIVGGLWSIRRDRAWWRLFYIAGLALGTLLYTVLMGPPAYVQDQSIPVIIVAGLLVGYGTRLGNGCTSGHGICGIARLSKRSITATIVFMASGILTVWLMRMITGGGL